MFVTLHDPAFWLLFAALFWMGAAGAILGAVVAHKHGITRGRELQAMELPQSGGVMHHREGNVIVVPAPDASAAIERVIRDSGRRTSLVPAPRPISRGWE